MFHQQQTSLDTVGFVSLDGYVDLFSNIFPNVNHGLNGKLLTITTLEVSEVLSCKSYCVKVVPITGYYINISKSERQKKKEVKLMEKKQQTSTSVQHTANCDLDSRQLSWILNVRSVRSGV